jgi:hypothetical protein
MAGNDQALGDDLGRQRMAVEVRIFAQRLAIQFE